MKKLFVVLAILLLCATVIIGCGTPTATTPAAPTTTAKPAPATSTVMMPPATTSAPATKPATTAPTTTKPAAAPLTPRYGGIMRLIEPAGPPTPIGWNSETSGGSVLSMQLSLQFPLKEMLGGKVVAGVAESYEVDTSPDKPSLTLKLRKGVKYHDGSPFNAQNVKWNFEWAIKGNMNVASTRYWKSIDVVDDYTVRINFTEWQNRVIRSFADGVAYCCSSAAYDKNGVEWIRWHMVGTGPFKQVDFQRDTVLKTVRYDDYWEVGKPYLEGVQYLYVADEMTRVALFKTGGAEVLNMAGNNRLTKELESAGYKIVVYSGGANVLVPDSANADSPWSNMKVRQAAEYAIEKEAIVKAFGYGYWKAADQINSSASMAYDSTITGRKYDPAKAKQLLTEAGYPNGFKTNLLVASGSNKDIPLAIKANLDAVGIQTELDVADAAKYQTYLSLPQPKNSLIINPLMEWANPNTGFNFFWGVPAGSFFKSTGRPQGWGDMLKASLATTAPDPAATQKMEKAAYDYSLCIPLYYGAATWAMTDKVQDAGFGTRGANTWWEPQNAWLSK